MNTSTITCHLTKGAELLPGYVLDERIGVGGYGEVWKVTAPGGLIKAVKFVYGRLDDKRATSELKSLDRIKGLTHPFLLTLERIECVDGHLTIVTELAEGCLRQRFDRCQESKLPGIPRDELLRYLSEAADALDYLSENHHLQHLDIKPENLLLVGNHVKVADFGLLKDLNEITASLVSGLTPKYASPEVFDGRPTRHSDQYSLAIVYAEMLTGKLPFNGQTAATLASQHLHCGPDLAALTPVERFAIGKALAKDPTERFSSCKEFVSRLGRRNRETTISAASVRSRTSNGDSGNVTNAVRSETDRLLLPGNHRPAEERHDGQTIAVNFPEDWALPALDLETVEPVYRPTLFVGVGGTGRRVLCRLRQLLHDCFGETATTEALQFLYIDTDCDSVDSATAPTTHGSLRNHETLALPIRDTWEYRKRRVGSLDSISRRWVYNVPRSRQTEGLRALGRLAMLDHSDRVLKALEASISAATDTEAIRATAKCTGLPFQEVDPNVYLIASLGGGTGGGMLLDMAYAVRQVLAESGSSNAKQFGILLCSLGRGSQKRTLAPANVFTCLEELHYFSLPGNDFPGEPACGLASSFEDAPAFDGTYLVGAGDEDSNGLFCRAVEQTATYLSLSTVSPTSAFVDACRQSTGEKYEENPLCLRSTGSVTLGVDKSSIRPAWTENLCKRVVQQWQDILDTTADNTPIKLSDQQRLSEACLAAGERHELPAELETRCPDTVRLDREHFVNHLRSMLQQELGCDVESYLYSMVSNSVGGRLTQNESTVLLALRRLHSVVGIEEESDNELSRQIESLRDLVDPAVREHAGTFSAAIESWVFELVNDSNSRISGARRAIEWTTAHVHALRDDAQRRFREVMTQRKTLRSHILEYCRDPKCKTRRLEADCRRYVELLVEEFLFGSFFKVVRTTSSLVTACAQEMRDLWTGVSRLADEFATAASGTTEDEDAAAGDVGTQHARYAPSLSTIVAEHHIEMLEALTREIDANFFGPDRTLQRVVANENGERAQLIDFMRTAARKVILRCANNVMMSHLQEDLHNGDTSRICKALQRYAKMAIPSLVESGGGGRRLVLMVPNSLETSRLHQIAQQALGETVTIMSDDESQIRLCYEVEAISVDGIKARLVRSRPDCEEISKRLHTRIDVSW